MVIRAVLVAATLGLLACKSRKTETSGGEVAPPTGRITEVDVSHFNLDMGKMRRWALGARSLAIAAQQDPSLAAAMATSGNEPVSQSITKLQRNSRAREILKGVGLTPREYVMIGTAYMQASLAAAAARANPPGMPPAGTNPRNVEFVQTHREQLDKLVGQVSTYRPYQ
ncbi:MAG TPA: hypothetical protein VFT29_11760 [Gemmatimonadaceae bacterium]|nr:hypothetical protein [Gemmatimonadaceae bacterium]